MSGGKKQRSPRERLLEAADDLFYNDGVHTVGIDRVLAQAAVAKASLYSNFGNKDGLVREYLRGRDERLRDRITQRMATTNDPRAQMLSLFDGLAARVQKGGYCGCPFIRASAEGPPGPNAAREVSLEHRAWRRDLFEKLGAQAGLANAREVSHQLSFLYDGAATAVVMDADEKAPLLARKAAERLIDAVLSNTKDTAKRKKREQ